MLASILAAALLQDPDALVRRLRSDDAAVRDEATARLKELGETARAALTAAADSTDPDVSARARFLLTILDLKNEIPAEIVEAVPDAHERLARGEWAEVLTDAAASEAFLVSRAALDALAVRAPATAAVARIIVRRRLESARSVLIESLPRLDEARRSGVFAALFESEWGFDDPALVDQLAHQDEAVRTVAASLIRDKGSRASARRALALLADERPGVRAEALGLLGDVELLSAGPRTAALLDDTDSRVRRAAVLLLGNLRDVRWGADVLTRLDDADDGVRSAAAGTLARMEYLPAIPKLIEATRDASQGVRLSALRALEAFQDDRSVPVLIERLEDPNESIRRVAIRILTTMRLAPVELWRSLADRSALVRAAAVLAMAELGRTDAVAQVEALLDDDAPQVCAAAAAALVRLSPETGIPRVLEQIRTGDKRAIQALQYAPLTAKLDVGIALLSDENPDRRSAGAKILQGSKAPEFADALRELARHESADIRGTAIDLLGEFDGPKTIETMAMLLADASPGIRGRAALEISKLEGPAAADHLRPLLKDEDAGVVSTAAKRLAAIGAAEAAPDLIALLEDERIQVRGAAVDALGDLGVKEALGPIRRLDIDNVLARAALGDPELADELREQLAGDDPYVALQAAERLGDAALADAVVPFLRHPDENLRYYAVTALAKMRHRESIPAIRDRLDDPQSWIREAAVSALVDLDARDEIPSLVRVLETDDETVKYIAVEALVALDARAQTDRLLKILRDGRDPWSAIAVLERLLTPDDFDPVVEMLDDPDPDVRSAATWLLRAGGAEASLIEMLDDPYADVRAAACRALEESGTSRCVEALAGRLTDESAAVRGNAARALGRLRAPGPLRDVLKDPSPRVRQAAIEALGRAGAKDAVGELIEILKSGRRDTEGDAAIALCRLGSNEGVETVMENGRAAIVLNGVRSPKPWNRLAETRLSEDLSGPSRDLLERAAAAAGFTVEWGVTSRDGKFRIRAGVTALSVWEDYAGQEWIIDGDRIRVISRDEAARFWREWWTR